MDNFKLYDTIISATYVNIAGYSRKEIFINNYDNNNYAHKVFLKVALMVANIENKQIYLNCGLITFLKTVFYHYRLIEIILHKCRFKFLKVPRVIGLDPTFYTEFEAQQFNVDMNIFKEIWKTYYAKKGEK